MKLLVLYRPNSEHATEVETYLHDFQARYHNLIDMIEVRSLDTREGAATASLYDIVSYPGLLVTTDEGQVIRAWQGNKLPLMDEVAGHMGNV